MHKHARFGHRNDWGIYLHRVEEHDLFDATSPTVIPLLLRLVSGDLFNLVLNAPSAALVKKESPKWLNTVSSAVTRGRDNGIHDLSGTLLYKFYVGSLNSRGSGRNARVNKYSRPVTQD